MSRAGRAATCAARESATAPATEMPAAASAESLNADARGPGNDLRPAGLEHARADRRK